VSNQTNLTNNAASDYYPVFSPDGSKIMFVSFRNDSEEIYIMNLDGSNQTNLTNNSLPDMYPVFSPDGSKIAFRSWSLGTNSFDIYIMDSNGSIFREI